jgi:hypothetical protein
MERAYWQRQPVDKPLFPDLIWNRPENKRHAGKLLIIGGHKQGFSDVAEAYNTSMKAGIGTARVLLPDSLQKDIGQLFPEAEFAPSTPSGSFARKSLAEILDAAAWADSVLLAGDFGRNSETAIVLESLLQKYSRQLTLTKDVVDYFAKSPRLLLDRPETTIVVSIAQLQQLATHSQFDTPIKYDMGVLQLVEFLHAFTKQHAAHIVIQYLDTMFVAVDGQISTTKLATPRKVWRVTTASHAATWWLQNQGTPYQAITTAVYESI